ncbi:FXSXX-COOH protein [Micromonospora sp. NPDC048830]|uniref:FXSXX-COOH protein n=1 Tax=Micromonospora sp. NPDC048830 TaxID=3364257 RepID=UPI00371FD5F9
MITAAEVPEAVALGDLSIFDPHGGLDVDTTARQLDPTATPAPLGDVRHTPLGRIPLDRARAVARVDDRRAERPARVDVAAFASSI